jgi:DNA-binding response OmpR family regulator
MAATCAATRKAATSSSASRNLGTPGSTGSRYAASRLYGLSPLWAEVYTFVMATPPLVEPRQVGILVLDDDTQSSGALRQILDSEGWRVRIVPDTKLLLAELKTAEWSLIIANVALVGLDTPLFTTLRELSSVSAEEGGRIRTLYLVPEMTGSQYVNPLEVAHLPYVIRPFHLHDFLEKVSDLLVEVKAIEAPLRQVRYEFGGLRKKKQQAGRTTSMFASRDSYSYTDEELAEYERMESEDSKTKRHKPPTNLGGGSR